MPKNILKDEPEPEAHGGRWRPRVLPLQPLLDAAGVGHSQLSRRCLASGLRVRQAASEGLTVAEAYSWADRLGLYPSEVWGTAWWEVAA